MGRGIQVDICTGWWNLKTPHKEIIDGIKVYRNFTFWGMFGIKGIRVLGSLIYMLTLGLYLLTHRREYDIIHVHQAFTLPLFPLSLEKKLLEKPVIVKTASSGMTSDIRQLRGYPLGNFQLRHLIKQMEVSGGKQQGRRKRI